MENAIHSSFFVFRVRQECEKRYGKSCVDFRTAYGKRKTVVFRFSDFIRREKNELTVHTRTQLDTKNPFLGPGLYLEFGRRSVARWRRLGVIIPQLRPTIQRN